VRSFSHSSLENPDRPTGRRGIAPAGRGSVKATGGSKRSRVRTLRSVCGSRLPRVAFLAHASGWYLDECLRTRLAHPTGQGPRSRLGLVSGRMPLYAIGSSNRARTSLTLFDVARFAFSPRGGSHKSAQGNALGPRRPPHVRALQGRNKTRISPATPTSRHRRIVPPLQGLRFVGIRVPRALPWAVMSLSLRDER
jgi:hypothetical protein